MKLRFRAWAAAVTLCIPLSVGQSHPSSLSGGEPRRSKVLSKFLQRHPEWRLLSLQDVGRWRADFERGFYEFKPFAFGDGNRDGRPDLAAVLVKPRPKKLYTVVCFNGISSGLDPNPSFVLLDSSERILGIEIVAAGIIPISCQECDANALFEWTGTGYEFFIPGDTVFLSAGTRVYSEPKMTSSVIFKARNDRSDGGGTEAQILSAGPLLPKQRGSYKRWYKIRTGPLDHFVVGFVSAGFSKQVGP